MIGKRRQFTALLGIACGVALSLPASTAYAAPYYFGPGFVSEDAGLLGTYTIYLVDSLHIEDFRAEADSVAAEIESITGYSVTVAPGVIASRAPARHQITMVVSALSGCMDEPTWLGCAHTDVAYGGGTRTDVEYVQGGNLTLNPTMVGLSAHVQRHVVAHEIGHTLGLKHYDAMYAGQYQMMRSTTSATGGDAFNYQAGDRNGFLYMRDRGL